VGPVRGGPARQRGHLDYADGDDIRAQHYAFRLDEDEFDAACARLRGAGIAYYADPFHEQPGRINHWNGGRGVYFAGPDGHNMELLTNSEAPDRMWRPGPLEGPEVWATGPSSF
jgi:catechol 2,3-dioxygenase-like lactoylglutathione lyase family enzyme